DTFFQGTFCGSNHFPAQPGRGHLHLVREGPATFVHADGTRLRVDAPTLILYPRPQAHGLDTGTGTAQLLCASVHLAGDGDAAIDSLPACLQ
ncbi:cupin domain-containing protein, partial [Salmonella enterica subsp. enterica]|nr:cupin domain-containing protein [Salmonella enterica]